MEKWPLGRIVKVFVEVKGSVLRIPVVKLCPLERNA